MIQKIIKKAVFLLIFIYSNLNAQSVEIKNVQTQEHTLIAGTKYAFIKPDSSFALSKNFTGFQSESLKAVINFTEMPMSFDMVLPMFTKDLPPKNGKLHSEKDLIINGNKAKLFKVESPQKDGSPSINWLLIYGNTNMSIIVFGIYPTAIDKDLSPKMEKSMMTFLYMADKTVNPLEQLSFTVKTDNTPLKFATIFMQTGAAFNLEGKYPPTSKKREMVNYMIMYMPFPVDEAEQKETAVSTVKKPYVENVELKETNPIDINGLKGYEVIGYEKDDKGNKNLKYAVALFASDKYYILQGSCQKDFDKNLAMFRGVSKTFSMKK
jgi:hypothetical protein